MFLHSSAPVQLAAWFVFLHKPQTHPNLHSLYQSLLQSHRAVRSSPVPAYCCPRKHIEGSWTRRSDRDEGHQHPSLTPKSRSLYASFGPHRINKSHSTPKFSASNTSPCFSVEGYSRRLSAAHIFHSSYILHAITSLREQFIFGIHFSVLATWLQLQRHGIRVRLHVHQVGSIS